MSCDCESLKKTMKRDSQRITFNNLGTVGTYTLLVGQNIKNVGLAGKIARFTV